MLSQFLEYGHGLWKKLSSLKLMLTLKHLQKMEVIRQLKTGTTIQRLAKYIQNKFNFKIY